MARTIGRVPEKPEVQPEPQEKADKAEKPVVAEQPKAQSKRTRK